MRGGKQKKFNSKPSVLNSYVIAMSEVCAQGIYLQVISLSLWTGKAQIMATFITFPRADRAIIVQCSLTHLPHHVVDKDDGTFALSLLWAVWPQAHRLGLHDAKGFMLQLLCVAAGL